MAVSVEVLLVANFQLRILKNTPDRIITHTKVGAPTVDLHAVESYLREIYSRRHATRRGYEGAEGEAHG